MRIISLLVGYILDLIFGDPVSLPHPICLIGNFIKKGEKVIRKALGKTSSMEIFGGMLLTVATVSLSFFLPWLILLALGKIHPYLALLVETVFCYQILATKCLKDESMKVKTALEEKGLDAGRYAVSMIVGRDTNELSEEGVIKAATETVAENTSDGVIAPMIYFAIGGAPLAFAYKAINTLDSMIGYKNDKYLYFGRFAAKVDDVANYIPARISGLLIVVSSLFTGYDFKNSWKIFKRDRRNHASPNSAQTESAVAGALRVQLAGDAVYFGKVYKKKTIGDDIEPITGDCILGANRLMYGAGALTLVLCILALVIGYKIQGII